MGEQKQKIEPLGPGRKRSVFTPAEGKVVTWWWLIDCDGGGWEWDNNYGFPDVIVPPALDDARQAWEALQQGDELAKVTEHLAVHLKDHQRLADEVGAELTDDGWIIHSMSARDFIAEAHANHVDLAKLTAQRDRAIAIGKSALRGLHGMWGGDPAGLIEGLEKAIEAMLAELEGGE